MEENNVPSQEPQGEHSPSVSPEQHIRLKSLRTYEGDVAEAISHTNTSITTIAVAEQKRRLAQPEPQIGDTIPTGAKNRLFGLVGTLLLILGISAIGGVYYSVSQNNKKIEVIKKETIISFSHSQTIQDSVSYEQFAETIRFGVRDFKQPVNSVLYFNIIGSGTTATGTTARKVASLFGPHMPDSLSRTLTSPYMVGIYSFSTNEPFIILTTEDSALGYAGMLSWEKEMVTDLAPIFGIRSTSTPYTFTDEELRNKDLRIVTDEIGKTILLYSFIDKNTILITSHEAIFNALLGKYLTGHTTR